MVIIAPAFTSVGVIPVINGCDAVDGVDGSDDFVQPDRRTAANNARMGIMQLSVFVGMLAPE
jgi:hypothetical protein